MKENANDEQSESKGVGAQGASPLGRGRSPRGIDREIADRIGIAELDLIEGRPEPHLRWGPEGTYARASASRPVPNLAPGEELDVAEILRGKTILLIGTTGFVGKVALSMLLHHYPDVGRVYCLVRPGSGNTADERFYRKVATSEAFRPLREQHGDGTEAFLRSKIVAIAGDIGRPMCNFDDATLAQLAESGGVDVVLNSAGLVSFMPSLESALRINAMGARNVLDVARRLGAKLVHVSTCYVCGEREGEVWEDEPVLGYFPRSGELRDRDFDATAEVADCQRIIDEARTRANDRQHISLFRERAAASLEAQRRDPDDEDDLKLAVARERKMWMAEQLTHLGMERSRHWGWTNTYTYTKSLGEQLILADQTVISTVVRPAVVESAVRFPFPGWNEGFNTTAPLVYLVLKGHRSIVAGADTALDLIPVDLVAAGMLLATAAILRGVHEPVYQLGASDVNRVTARRLTEMTGLAVRKHFRDKADAGEEVVKSRIRARLEGMSVSYDHFQKRSSPLFKRLADGASKLIDERLPRWGAPRLEAWAERAKDELAKVSRFSGQVIDLVELFKPFNFDREVTFRADNLRALWRACSPADREKLWWGPEAIDWREYWLGVHFTGLQKWVFPTLDDEFGPKPRSVYTYKELLELWDATVKLHRHQVALKLRRKDPDAEPVTYTYERIGDMAMQGSGMLRQLGVVAGDRVMLMSENRPEWGISYFAILQAGATAVPLDKELSPAEVANLANASKARVLIVSRKVVERLCADEGLAVPELDDDARDLEWSAGLRLFDDWLKRRLGNDAPAVYGFDELLAEPAVSPGAVRPPVRGDTVASVIFTSGTTGTPKGVMLTHKNFTSMVAKLAGVFQLYRHDGLLSVLPLHHTFEFSAGFLMPLMHGASVTYLEEIDADSLGDALATGTITGLVGVPALWQLLERKIFKTVSDRGLLVERAFEAILDLNRGLRDAMPWGIGVGKVLFFPVHRKLGGRLRFLISGGSALPADTLKSFQGLGLDLHEGYGMTEASPVLTVTRPGDKVIPGSVGRPLAGIDIKIDQPDEHGVGEVIAKGPNVMVGYHDNPGATAETLKDGWLHTGDLGKLDGDGNLFIVGRKKELILGPSGENVYPDELEDLYGDSPYVKEVSVVGLPAQGTNETVAALIVPEYEPAGSAAMTRDEIRDRVRDHVREVSKGLPIYKRVKVFHLWDHDLPKTSTRKIKRREIVAELERLERAAKSGAEIRKQEGGAPRGDDAAWVREVIVGTAQKKGAAVGPETRLEDLGYDSLMFTELVVALEAAGVALPDPSELTGLETIGDVEKLVARLGAAQRRNEQRPKAHNGARGARNDPDDREPDDIDVPRPLVRIGRRVLGAGQRALYDRFLDTTIHGEAYIPPFGGYIVAANHASHLDMGLCKYALGEQGDALVALAAKDYFFEDPVRRMYFENFTNLIPMERHGSLRESLRLAGDVIRQGYILLIFPEGTRSDTGVMTDFKASLGYLAMQNRCGILPMYLAGTYDAMPKGNYLPKARGEVAAHIGPFQSYEALVKLSEGKSRAESYRAIAGHCEGIVRKLAPKRFAWTLSSLHAAGNGAGGSAPEEVEP